MKYDHHLKITDSSQITGQQDPDTGLFVPDGGQTPGEIYDDGCDAQEMGGRSSGTMVRQDDGQLLEVSGELEIFLEDETKAPLFKPGLTGTLTRGSIENQITVKAVRQIDGAIIADTL